MYPGPSLQLPRMSAQSPFGAKGVKCACRSFNSYIDYPNRGQTYEMQHDEFHNSDTPNRFLAYGALVGGPGADDKYAPSL